jgi:hypothetical protein
MKKLAITLSLALVGTMSAFSQGTIAFAGSSAFPLTISTSTTGSPDTKTGAGNATSVALGAGGGQVTIELFVGTSTSTLLLAGITTNATSTATAAQGAYVNQNPYVLGSDPNTGGSAFTAASFGTGSTVDFQYYAYTANGLYTGQSAIETGYTLGGGATSPSATFGSGAGQVDGFTLVPTPEPSTIALGGLGAAALLLFRRRK